MTPRQLDTLAAWWQCGGSNVGAARMMGITPQVVRNRLMQMRQVSGVPTTLALANKHLSQVQKRQVLPVGSPFLKKPGMTAEQYNLYRQFRYKNDPEYRERMKRQAVKGVRKMRSLDPVTIARQARYAALVEVQGEQCAICGGQEPRLKTSDGTPHRLAIDHDHANGQERALLCSSCNLMLGSGYDSPERLEQGAAYLRWWRKQHKESEEEAERA